MSETVTTKEEFSYPQKYDAPEGKIWVCAMCHKISSNRAEGSRGWDESCFLNAQLRDK